MFRHTLYASAIVTALLMMIFTAGTIHAQTAQEYYDQGMALKEAGDLEGAIKMLEKAAKNKREFPEAHYELALCYMEKNTLNVRLKAFQSIEHALKIDPDNTKYLRALADNYTLRTFPENARDVYQKIIDIDPG
ncbi:tetratricopeptide repeat protein, partial [candidate division KSB1 bacterium]